MRVYSLKNRSQVVMNRLFNNHFTLILNIIKGKNGSSLSPIANPDRAYLAILDRYHHHRINASFDLLILHRYPWGGRFQTSVIGERQFDGGNGRTPSGQEGDISSGYGKFLAR